MGLTKEDEEKIIEVLKRNQIKICDEDWYIDYIMEDIWYHIPVDARRPSLVPTIKGLIMDRISEVRDEFMKSIGLIEDEDEEGIEYIINIDILDEVAGTVYSVLGGGPGYRDIVNDLEMAAGAVMFYEYRDKMPGKDPNPFTITIKIYRNGEIMNQWSSPGALYMGVVDILRDARYDMARIYNEDRKEKERENNESE